MKKKLLIYELNELPPRLLFEYIKLRPYSNFSYLYKNNYFLETYTRDTGELHPWVTWPSLYRGVPNYIHQIKYINQDLSIAKKYPPVWEELVEFIDVGIFGSLQSYPPPLKKNYKFFLPDTFAPDSQAYPHNLRKFQNFNLGLAANNKAFAKSINLKSLIELINLISIGQFKINSLSKTTIHVLKEFLIPKYKKRRQLIYPILGFDVFWKHYLEFKPSFSTFFTNHLASVMHRYWYDLFPDDYESDKEPSLFNSQSIIKALDISDKQVGIILKFIRNQNTDLWILSSMGQQAIDRGNYISELYLYSFSKFLEFLGFDPKRYTLLPSMQPDICISCASKDDLINMQKEIQTIVDIKGKQFIYERYNATGLRVNFFLSQNENLLAKNEFLHNGKLCKLSDMGLKLIDRDQGTGYHSPEGVFLATNNIFKLSGEQKDLPLDICKIKKMIKNFFI